MKPEPPTPLQPQKTSRENRRRVQTPPMSPDAFPPRVSLPAQPRRPCQVRPFPPASDGSRSKRGRVSLFRWWQQTGLTRKSQGAKSGIPLVAGGGGFVKASRLPPPSPRRRLWETHGALQGFKMRTSHAHTQVFHIIVT